MLMRLVPGLTSIAGALLLVAGHSPQAAAFPLSRFTERITGSMINEQGTDPNVAEPSA